MSFLQVIRRSCSRETLVKARQLVGIALLQVRCEQFQ